MGKNLNIGADTSLTVFGNPESFRKLIKNHGQLCKIKQSLPCPCMAQNFGTPNRLCTLCNGTGYLYTYQRRFLIADENPQCNDDVTELYPYFVPVMEVSKVENVVSPIQGGITQAEVVSFNDTTIKIKNPGNDFKKYDRRRVTYFFDGWTHITGDVLKVDAAHGLMWPTKTYYDAQYQSSNPLLAEADIAAVERLYNKKTGKTFVEGKDYKRYGNTFRTTKKITQGDMVCDYYYADLTQIITADLKTKDDLEKWTNDMESGNIRLAMYPWFNITKGDLVVIAADAQYKNQLLAHRGDLDELWEVEVFELNDVIVDEDGGTYFREKDFILIGNRYILWISDHRPKDEKNISVKYGYKPTFICFEDNPEPNNLENRRYPKIIYTKRWSKTKAADITKLLGNAE